MSEEKANQEHHGLRCQRCGTVSADMMPVEAGMRLALQAEGRGLPDKVCPTCYSQLSSNVSRGVKLRMEEKARSKNKAMMWKSRVNLVKQARQLMIQKSYSEAAVSYEKYIRVLEIAHDLKAGELTPDVFSSSSRSKELTVVASSYWDLMRIYDSSKAHRKQMQKAANKLALFAPFSPIYPNLLKKAQSFTKSSKNPDIVKSFLKQSRRNRPRCFIATVVFEYPMAPEIQQLRAFRDKVLKKSMLGRRLIYIYYKHSPGVADFLEQQRLLRAPIRLIIRIILPIIKLFT